MVEEVLATVATNASRLAISSSSSIEATPGNGAVWMWVHNRHRPRHGAPVKPSSDVHRGKWGIGFLKQHGPFLFSASVGPMRRVLELPREEASEGWIHESHLQEVPAGPPEGAAGRIPQLERRDLARRFEEEGKTGTLEAPAVMEQEKMAVETDCVVKVGRGPYDGGFDSAECLLAYCLDCNFRWIHLWYLWRVWKAGEIIPRCQDVPDEAFATKDEMLTCFKAALQGGSQDDGCAFAVSHPWFSKDHPDPHGVQLDWLVRRLDTRRELSLRLVFFDYCCLPQEPRSCSDKKRFHKALKNMHVSFTHDSTEVLLFDLPVPKHEENQVPYDDRGWCTLERYAALMKPTGRFQCSLLDSAPGPCLSEAGDVLPNPQDFRKKLDAKVFSSTTADKENVNNLYANLFAARIEELLSCTLCKDALCSWRVSQRSRAQQRDELLVRTLALWDEALQLNPAHAEAHYGRGRTLEDLGRLPEARRAFLHASRLKPNAANARALSRIRGEARPPF